MCLFLLVTFYASMVLAALCIEFLFSAAGWIPEARNLDIAHAGFSLNYTTILNGVALLLAGRLYFRYRRTGGPQMMKSMANGEHDGHEHGGHHHPDTH